jgi:hypothetical protein
MILLAAHAASANTGPRPEYECVQQRAAAVAASDLPAEELASAIATRCVEMVPNEKADCGPGGEARCQAIEDQYRFEVKSLLSRVAYQAIILARKR